MHVAMRRRTVSPEWCSVRMNKTQQYNLSILCFDCMIIAMFSSFDARVLFFFVLLTFVYERPMDRTTTVTTWYSAGMLDSEGRRCKYIAGRDRDNSDIMVM